MCRGHCLILSSARVEFEADMLVFLLLIGVVLVLAFFGAGTFAGVLLFCTFLLSLACLVLPKDRTRPMGRLAVCAVLLILFLAVTIMPIPVYLERVFGSERAAQNQVARGVVNDIAGLGLVDKAAPFSFFSRNRAGTMRILLMLISGFSAAALASRMPAKWKERYLQALVLTGCVVAIAGYMSQWVFPQEKKLWWLLTVPHGRPVGSFINRNHFAGFVTLLCPAAVVLFGEAVAGKKIVRSIIWGTCFVVMSFVVFGSLSRGAWLAYIVSGFALLVFALVEKKVVRALGVLALTVCVVAVAVRLPHDGLEDRVRSLGEITETSSGQLRVETWRSSVHILADYPFMGAGANGFKMAFPQYRTATTRKSFHHAENEYVQIPVEFGLIGFSLIVALCWCLAAEWWSVRSRGAITRSIGISFGGALAVVLVHACFEFALRLPLYFIVFCSLVGLVLSPTLPSGRRRVCSCFSSGIVLPSLALILAGMIALSGRKIHDMDNSDFMERADIHELATAILWSPTSWQAWYHMGRAVIIEQPQNGREPGEKCIAIAVSCDPNNYRLWSVLGRMKLNRNDIEGALDAERRLRELRPYLRIRELDGQRDF
jgi:O-antigen ligase